MNFLRAEVQMNKEELITALSAAHLEFWRIALDWPKQNIRKSEKWTVAQNVEHITLVLGQIKNYFSFPKEVIKANYGYAERESMSYEEFVTQYKQALTKGAKATAPFIPQIEDHKNLIQQVNEGRQLLDELIEVLNKWSDREIETYNCRHPILGKTTAREILYFTIYHVQHHADTIKKMERN